MRALVRDDRLEVGHVTHDGVLVHDAHTSEHLTHITGDVNRHVNVVALGHGDLGGGCATLIAQHPKAVREQLRLCDLCDGFGQLLLLQLEPCNRTAKLRPLLRVTQAHVIAVQGSPDGAPCDAVTGAVQTAQRRAQTGPAGKDVRLGNADVVEDQFSSV